MPKATFTVQNGTHIEIEGTTQEVQDLLDYYLRKGDTSDRIVNVVKNASNSDDPLKIIPKKTKPEESDIQKIIDTTKTCEDAALIEKYILDQSNEANRVLLALYIIYKYYDNAFGLTTTEISKFTIELGIKIARQNTLRALKNSAKGFVLKSGKPSRYTLNRRGYSHLTNILEGSKINDSEDSTISGDFGQKKVKSRKKVLSKKKGPKSLIIDLINNGFFVEKRSLSEVQKKLNELGFLYKLPALSPSLLALVRSNNLNRIKENDIWLYIIN